MMQRLEDFVNNVNTINNVNNINENANIINEESEFLKYDASDSGIMKLFKGILRFISGSTEEKEYNPTSRNYNKDAVEEKIKEWQKDNSTKTAEKISFSEIKSEQISKLFDQNILNNTKKDYEANKKLYENISCKAASVNNIEGICKNMPTVYYFYNKGLYKNKYMYIVSIESIYPYDKLIDIKAIIKEIGKDMKNIGATGLIIRFANSENDISYELLQDYIEKSNTFERNKKLEKSKKERVFVYETKKKQQKKTEPNE